MTTLSRSSLRTLILHAAEKACQAHPQSPDRACQRFAEELSQKGVRVNRVPDLVLASFTGAIDRSLGDPKAAAWRVQSDLAPMASWLGWRAPVEKTTRAA